MDDIKVGIYVPSYKRYDKIMTYHILNKCTYVVRESEAELYRAAGISDLLVAPDDEINSLPKIRQWIIDNTPEPIVIQIDDDIKEFLYNHKNSQQVLTKDEVDIELSRFAQMIVDLGIGLSSISMRAIPYNYQGEFQFTGLIGGVVIFNKTKLKSKYDTKIISKVDVDVELQELLHNRIILIPKYFVMTSGVDTNKGGSNDTKTLQKIEGIVEYLKTKWGKYFNHDYRKNISKVNVKR